MKYIKLYDNRHDFVFDEQRYFPNTSLVNGEEEPSYFTDVEEVVFELTVTLPTEKVVTGQTYTLAVEYGGADVFSEATVTTTGDVTLNGTQFTANTDGDFSVTATYDGKTVTLNGTSKLMTAAPRISFDDSGCGIYKISIVGNAPKRITFNGEEFTPYQQEFFNYKNFYADLTEQTVFVTATAEEEGKWESDVATATYTIPVLQNLTATISDDTLEDGQTAQMTVMYGNQNVTEHIGIKYTASGDVTCTNGNVLHIGAGVVTATYSTGSGSIVVSSNDGLGNPNLTPITINVTVREAAPKNIVFADPDVKAIVANAYGSNGEITEEQAAAVTTWFEGGYNNTATNPFCKNESVDSFDEFGTYFTSVSEIGVDAFQACSNMRSITLPSSLTSIPDYTFSGCSSLGSVTIPAAVTAIGNRVFDGCTLLESINIPENVSSIGSRVFERCPILTYISVDASNSYFNDGNGSNAIIDNNGNLVYGGCACTVIPNTVNSIGENAFHSRYFGEHTLTIPSSVTAIGNYAFGGRLDIHPDYYLVMEGTTPPTLGTGNDFGTYGVIFVPQESVDTYKAAWSNHADRIRAYFTVSLSSESIVTGETYTLYVNYCGEDVFSNATITSTGDVTITRNGHFTDFTANSDGAFSITATYNGYTATLNGTAATPEPEPEPVSPNIVFADPDVKAIVTNAYGSDGEITEAQAAAVPTFMSGTDSSTNGFYGNTNISSFDEFRYFTALTEIGDNTFANCSNMTSIIIPSSVTSIGNRAVRGCSSLTRIICEAIVPPTLGNGVFGTTNGCPLFVPEESLDDYKSIWSTYASRIKPFGVTVSLSSENIVTGETYTLSVKYNGVDVLSNATVTSTGDVTISGNSFTANSDGAFSITATYNGYTATLNGTAYTTESAVAVLDCSQLKDADPLEECFNGYYDEELEEDVVYQEPRIDCTFSGNVAVESGVITMSDDSMFDMFMIEDQVESIGYIKLTHPSAEYKVDTRYVEFNGGMYDYEAITVTFDSATLTTTISNFVSPSPDDPDFGTFNGEDFSMKFKFYGSTVNPIKITRIEVGYVTPSK